jgi:hypothetical protein
MSNKQRECRFTIQRTGSPLDFEVYDYDEKRIVAVCKSWEDGGLVAAALTDFTNKAKALAELKPVEQHFALRMEVDP